MSGQQTIHPAKRPSPRRGKLSVRLLSWSPSASLMLLLVSGVLAASPQFAAAQDDRVGEYELKAAILFNLTRFVEWPPSAYGDPQVPTVLCILGRDPFGSALTALVPKPAANVRPVLIRRLKNLISIRDCHLLYISSSERKALPQIFSALNGSSTLTVGEMTQFATQGGIVQFTLQDQQVRFEINLDAASRVGLKISSRLLVLARVVGDKNRNSDGNGDASRSHSFRMTPPSPGLFRAEIHCGDVSRTTAPGESSPAAFSSQHIHSGPRS